MMTSSGDVIAVTVPSQFSKHGLHRRRKETVQDESGSLVRHAVTTALNWNAQATPTLLPSERTLRSRWTSSGHACSTALSNQQPVRQACHRSFNREKKMEMWAWSEDRQA